VIRRALVGLIAACGIGACGTEEGPEVGIPASFEAGQAEPSALASVDSEPVQGFAGPGGTPFEVATRTHGGPGRLERRIGTRTFSLPLRTDGLGLTQYPCGSCHQGRVTARRDPDVHENVEAVHPPGIGATCVACHSPGAVETLTLIDGGTATFDHAYRLCAQCHFAQVDAWAEGHHGKRLDGWRGRRVVMGCAECHDPHGPTVARRAPFPGPRLPASGTLLPGGAAPAEDAELRFPLPPGPGGDG
jgi:hypothetical protein